MVGRGNTDVVRALREHWRHGCERVRGTICHQASLRAISVPFATIVISPTAGWQGHTVTLADGTPVGHLRQDQLANIVIGPGSTTVAEVAHPRYRATRHVGLYVPLRTSRGKD